MPIWRSINYECKLQPSGADKLEHATAIYSCHGVFIEKLKTWNQCCSFQGWRTPTYSPVLPKVRTAVLKRGTGNSSSRKNYKESFPVFLSIYPANILECSRVIIAYTLDLPRSIIRINLQLSTYDQTEVSSGTIPHRPGCPVSRESEPFN